MFSILPGFNVMTNRNTVARRLYVDDAVLIWDPSWQSRIIERIVAGQPPLIIIHNVALNGTEISRFPNWATKVMRHITSNYRLSESIWSIDFYVRIADKDGGAALSDEDSHSEL